jgi:aminoglycoside phosphotransferase family enzyme/predicted kinase
LGTLRQDLLDQGLELRETHISLVFLAQDRVYKVKKPVALGFLDFSTLERRRAACEAEVALNRRLAPDVYLGVLPIARDASGVHRIGAQGDAVEWAVEMVRMPDHDAASQLLTAGRLERAHVRQLAERLARFHEAARCDAHTASFGTATAILENVRENFAQTRHSAAEHLDSPTLVALERWQLDFIRTRGALFEARIAAGRVRDGHGDLRLEHCYLSDDGAVRILDCIEFNERFRYADVCADIAFLAMDLAFNGREDLSEGLLADYARASGDYDIYGLGDFYESYRAFVRAKVSGMLEAEPAADSSVRARAAADARKFYLLSAAATHEPLAQPVLYAVAGVIASGKSSVAESLGELVRAPVIDADRMRKRLAGVAETQALHDPSFGGHYSAQASARVYAELLRLAEVVVRSGRPVVLEASFRAQADRLALLRLAQELGVTLRFLECVAPLAICRQRLQERARGASISDGRTEIFDAFVAAYEPVTELPPTVHVKIDTSRPVDAVRAGLRARFT